MTEAPNQGNQGTEATARTPATTPASVVAEYKPVPPTLAGTQNAADATGSIVKTAGIVVPELTPHNLGRTPAEQLAYEREQPASPSDWEIRGPDGLSVAAREILDILKPMVLERAGYAPPPTIDTDRGVRIQDRPSQDQATPAEAGATAGFGVWPGAAQAPSPATEARGGDVHVVIGAGGEQILVRGEPRPAEAGATAEFGVWPGAAQAPSPATEARGGDVHVVIGAGGEQILVREEPRPTEAGAVQVREEDPIEGCITVVPPNIAADQGRAQGVREDSPGRAAASEPTASAERPNVREDAVTARETGNVAPTSTSPRDSAQAVFEPSSLDSILSASPTPKISVEGGNAETTTTELPPVRADGTDASQDISDGPIDTTNNTSQPAAAGVATDTAGAVLQEGSGSQLHTDTTNADRRAAFPPDLIADGASATHERVRRRGRQAAAVRGAPEAAGGTATTDQDSQRRAAIAALEPGQVIALNQVFYAEWQQGTAAEQAVWAAQYMRTVPSEYRLPAIVAYTEAQAKESEGQTTAPSATSVGNEETQRLTVDRGYRLAVGRIIEAVSKRVRGVVAAEVREVDAVTLALLTNKSLQAAMRKEALAKEYAMRIAQARGEQPTVGELDGFTPASYALRMQAEVRERQMAESPQGLIRARRQRKEASALAASAARYNNLENRIRSRRTLDASPYLDGGGGSDRDRSPANEDAHGRNRRRRPSRNARGREKGSAVINMRNMQKSRTVERVKAAYRNRREMVKLQKLQELIERRLAHFRNEHPWQYLFGWNSQIEELKLNLWHIRDKIHELSIPRMMARATGRGIARAL